VTLSPATSPLQFVITKWRGEEGAGKSSSHAVIQGRQRINVWRSGTLILGVVDSFPFVQQLETQNKFQKQGRDYSTIMLPDRFCIPGVGTCAFVSYVFATEKNCPTVL